MQEKRWHCLDVDIKTLKHETDVRNTFKNKAKCISWELLSKQVQRNQLSAILPLSWVTNNLSENIQSQVKLWISPLIATKPHVRYTTLSWRTHTTARKRKEKIWFHFIVGMTCTEWSKRNVSSKGKKTKSEVFSEQLLFSTSVVSFLLTISGLRN